MGTQWVSKVENGSYLDKKNPLGVLSTPAYTINSKIKMISADIQLPRKVIQKVTLKLFMMIRSTNGTTQLFNEQYISLECTSRVYASSNWGCRYLVQLLITRLMLPCIQLVLMYLLKYIKYNLRREGDFFGGGKLTHSWMWQQDIFPSG